jgi:hypothetical protein
MRPNVAAEPRAPTSPTFTSGEKHGTSREIPVDQGPELAKQLDNRSVPSEESASRGERPGCTKRRIGARERPPASQPCCHDLETVRNAPLRGPRNTGPQPLAGLESQGSPSPQPVEARGCDDESPHRPEDLQGHRPKPAESRCRVRRTSGASTTRANRPVRDERHANARSNHRDPRTSGFPLASAGARAPPRRADPETPLGQLPELPGTTERFERGCLEATHRRADVCVPLSDRPTRKKTTPDLAPLREGAELSLGLGSLRRRAVTARRDVAPMATEVPTTPERARRNHGSPSRLGCDRSVADIATDVGLPGSGSAELVPVRTLTPCVRERRFTGSTLSPAPRRICKRPILADGHRPKRLHPKVRAPLSPARGCCQPFADSATTG